MTEAPETPRLLIEPHGWTAAAPANLSLLEAAQHAGFRLPRSCRNGTCRSCICQMLEGSVRYRIDWPGLSSEEKAEGWILPCVAVAVGDVTIDAPRAIKEI